MSRENTKNNIKKKEVKRTNKNQRDPSEHQTQGRRKPLREEPD